MTCTPSVVFVVPSTLKYGLMSAAKPVEGRDSVTRPVAATAGSLVRVKSPTYVSTSVPALVANRDPSQTWTIRYWTHMAKAPLASMTERVTDPVVRFRSFLHAFCAAAAPRLTSAGKLSSCSCIEA
jgi:hypothetical protein